MKKQQTVEDANCGDLLMQAAYFVISKAYTILPACPNLYHGLE
jgi:hypothetical protein